jgi:hypothetical protein
LEIAAARRSLVVRVLVITGAGVSAESGIPTFRGKDGYWRNLDPMKLATPEAFARDPELVWQWYRERRHSIRNAQPNAAHEAIANLAQGADEFLLVTQNVDDLHQRAGLAKAEVVQIHGDISLPNARAAVLIDTITRLWSPRRASRRRGRKMAFRDVRNAMRSCGLAWFGSESLCLCVKPDVLRTICSATPAGL